MAKKVYAIQYGFDSYNNKPVENIIVNTWSECLSFVKGVKGAKYKSFERMEDAEGYLNEGSRMLKKNDDSYPKDCLHAYVDGSFNSSDNRYSYGLVCVKNNVVEYIESGASTDTSKKNIRQIAGELDAAMKAAQYALSQGEKKIVIFHDYEGIAHHATGAWSRKEESSVEYYNKMQQLMNNGIEVIFVKVDSHTGDLFNELADEKCKECLGIQSDKTVYKFLKSNDIIVLNEKVKSEILSLAPSCENNIIIQGEEKKNIVKEEHDDEKERVARFEEISETYKKDKFTGEKVISKMLTKDKTEYIIYLLNKLQDNK